MYTQDDPPCYNEYMGFFGDLSKAFLGQSTKQDIQSDTAEQGGVLDARGFKIIPVITMTDLRSHRDGNELRVTAWIMNDSDQRIRLDSCYLLKQKNQYDHELGPHQSHEFTLYQGPVPHDESEHRAQIVYRLQANGDSFQRNYRIEYHVESGGSRTVDRLEEDGPVRDV